MALARGVNVGFTDKYDVDRLLYWLMSRRSQQGNQPREAIEGLAPLEENRADRVLQSALAGSGTRPVSMDEINCDRQHR
jgi:hypothetical protein